VNQRRAIDAFRAALEVHNIREYSHDYAMDQSNLGVTYQDYVGGERIGNLDRAMECFISALLVQTDPDRRRILVRRLADAFNARMDLTPEDHRGEVHASLRPVFNALIEAQIEGRMAFGLKPEWLLRVPTPRLGTNEDDHSWQPDSSLFLRYRLDEYQTIPLYILVQRLMSSKADDPTLRIEMLRAMLAREDVALPSFRAMLLDKLATAQLENRTCNVVTNQEEALSTLDTALAAYTRDDDPTEWGRIQWGRIQAHRGWLLRERISGDRAENLERAIECSGAAIETLPSESVEWAHEMSNLGVLYRERRLGDRRENSRMAIAAFQEALQFFTRDGYPYGWARVQNSMGLTYLNQPDSGGEEEAISAFKAALTVLTREEFPYEWAGTEFNLATAMEQRRTGNRADNIEETIRAYKASLLVRTREGFPVDWAQTQHNLGQAYSQRIHGERATNLQLAADCFHAALTVLTVADRPADHRSVIGALGMVEAQRG
jgi:tetratricopeptide (TPR) repeat protein